ncbi:hypothetical protein BGX30_006425 [Mortierella sp. GBA39]|nr:hypothetical protein BGX30_006425 [Mortierella sp. GBA39]
MGLAAAGGDDLLLLNNDVTVTANWLTNMLAALHSREDVGLVGPVTNAASGRQKVEVAFQNIEEFQQVAARNNQSDPSRWVEVNRIIGMCLLMKRDVLSRIGFLDEAFSPGHYEDDDYCYRARLAGYRLLVCGDALVYHQGSASFMRSASDQIQQLIDRNHRLFMDKWHIDPRQFIEKAGSISEGGGVQLRQAGITEILIVMGKQSAGLYTDFLGSGQDFGVQLTYRIQESAGGIAEALDQARSFIVKDEKFVVLLGDNLFLDDLGPYVNKFMRQPAGTARVLLKQVQDARRYGVPVFDRAHPELISLIEEKPAKPKSSYCVTGFYMYDTAVFDIISGIRPSDRGELEITDVNNVYAADGRLEYDILQQWWSDAGTFESLQEAGKKMKGILP